LKKLEGTTPYFNVAMTTFAAFLGGLLMIWGCQCAVEKMDQTEKEEYANENA